VSIGLGQASALGRLIEAIGRWADAVGVAPSRLPRPADLAAVFGRLPDPCRPPPTPALLDDWEHRHDFPLPRGLRAWLELSDGFHLGAPVIHPIKAIGPMVPFARVAGLMVQPESWFEIGNPTESETVCVDLAYRWPGGDFPLFTSGDDEQGAPPRVIAPSFEDWFLRLLHEGGKPFWLDPAFAGLGDPWELHRLHSPAPDLPDSLTRLIDRARPLVRAGIDERLIARRLEVSRSEAEALVRHLQHLPIDPAAPRPD
jgi:hypothetical protein